MIPIPDLAGMFGTLWLPDQQISQLTPPRRQEKVPRSGALSYLVEVRAYHMRDKRGGNLETLLDASLPRRDTCSIESGA
jgi:hypothetical protein